MDVKQKASNFKVLQVIDASGRTVTVPAGAVAVIVYWVRKEPVVVTSFVIVALDCEITPPAEFKNIKLSFGLQLIPGVCVPA